MKNPYQFLSLLVMLTSFQQCAVFPEPGALNVQWNQLSPLPDSVGFAGSFAGVSNDALIVAGGANFPDGGAPWEGSVKKWYDKIFVLEKKNAQWKEVGKLPRALGYGVSVTWNNSLLCFGGSNEEGHYSNGFMINYQHGKIFIDSLPSLPTPIANSCGAVVNNIVYIAGGTTTGDAKETENNFWSLDLSKEDAERKWKKLASWPGSSRMLSVAGATHESFFLFSGTKLTDGRREYLKDAFAFSEDKGWTKIEDLPNPVVAAPSTAVTIDNQLLIFGGDDGTLAAEASTLKNNHPGFSNSILGYDLTTNKWTHVGVIETDKKADAALYPNNSTWAPVTTSLVTWNNAVVIPGGEVRPATRTPRVLMASIKS